MNEPLRRFLLLGALAVFAAGCAHTREGNPILIDNERNWSRTEESAFVVYRIKMSGVPSFTTVVVPDEPAKKAFLSLYPPQVLSNKGHIAFAGVKTVEEYKAGAMGPHKEKDIDRLVEDMKGRSAVVFDYLNEPKP